MFCNNDENMVVCISIFCYKFDLVKSKHEHEMTMVTAKVFYNTKSKLTWQDCKYHNWISRSHIFIKTWISILW